ncbi:unnamed protein product [Citrullus colocynthis]|uniref:Uncharacterized protein n=1 Tax=Citrullus colocynthis TaxID=252529 RepID=A0ABP0XQR0_9ROSI
MDSETGNQCILKDQTEPSSSSYVELQPRSGAPMIFKDQSQLSTIPSSSEDRQERQIENLDEYFLSRDRERRTIRPSIRFLRADCISNHSTISNFEDPSSFEDALMSNEKNQWLATMKSEINSLHKKETWVRVWSEVRVETREQKDRGRFGSTNQSRKGIFLQPYLFLFSIFSLSLSRPKIPPTKETDRRGKNHPLISNSLTPEFERP